MDIEKLLIELASKSFRKDASEITPETDIRKELSGKSIMMLAFISAIENELDVAIPMSQANHLNTIQDFVNAVKEKL